MPRYELVEGPSNKSGEITGNGKSFTVRHGRTGADGQSTTRAARNAEEKSTRVAPARPHVVIVVALCAGASLSSCIGLQRALAGPIQCTGGAELVAGGCYCAGGQSWNGLACQGAPDHGQCQGGGYPFGPPGEVSCHCLLSQTLDAGGNCVDLQCTGGAVPGNGQCVCPDGAAWNGSQCVIQQPACADGTVWDGAQCSAPAASQDDTSQACPDGTDWDGATCAAPSPERRTCRSVLLAMSYGAGMLSLCNGVSNRCAVALLDHKYEPGMLTLCRNVEGACAEQLIARGDPPGNLVNCRRARRGR